MKYFLNEHRRQELDRLMGLTQNPDEKKSIKQLTIDVPDDMDAVDQAMLMHVKTIAILKKHGKHMSALVGMACLKFMMEEGQDRGLGENDFPRALAAIKDELAGRGVINLQ